jgi:hypothetical protein
MPQMLDGFSRWIETRWIEKRRASRRRMQTDARALIQQDERNVYYAAQQLHRQPLVAHNEAPSATA